MCCGKAALAVLHLERHAYRYVLRQSRFSRPAFVEWCLCPISCMDAGRCWFPGEIALARFASTFKLVAFLLP